MANKIEKNMDVNEGELVKAPENESEMKGDNSSFLVNENENNSEMMFEDSFADRRNETEENVVEKNNVFVGIAPLSHLSGTSAKGNKWHDLRITFNYVITNRKGEKVASPLTVSFKPKKGFGEKFLSASALQVFDLICGDDKTVPLDIVVTERKNNDTGAVSINYTPRVSYTSPEGKELVTVLEPYNLSDSSIWDLFIGELKAYGKLPK